jgi:dTDP-4-amino-4,6-dideoxygalactose transaminase
MKVKIPLFKIFWDKDDIDSVTKVIKRGNYWTTGPDIELFEDNIKKYFGIKYAISFNSGTSALHADLLAHNIKKGSEVIVPSFTFISTANAVVLTGAKPIFAEIEDASFGLDPTDVKEKITKKTKAIIPVHYGGSPCKEIKALKEIAEDYKILLIEDAAESIGSKVGNKLVGTFGNSAMFSFCQNKVITSGEGGIIITDSKQLYERLKLIRSHGRIEKSENYFTSSEIFDYKQAGYNYRISSITASLANSQLKKINKIIKMRREKANYYNKNLQKIKNIKIPTKIKNYFHVYQMYTIQLNNNKNRDKLQQTLLKAGIMSKIYFYPIHLRTLYKKEFNYKKGDLPKTEKISQKVLTLPLYPSLSNKEIDYIIYQIKNCCE